MEAIGRGEAKRKADSCCEFPGVERREDAPVLSFGPRGPDKPGSPLRSDRQTSESLVRTILRMNGMIA